MSARLCLLFARAAHVLLRASTGPVDALVYWYALCWFAFLAFTPDAAFSHTAAHTLLQYKSIWVWPALVKVITSPIGWISERAWVHHAARIYALMWWAYLVMATAIITPGVVVFWAPALGSLVVAIWLLAREGAHDIAVSDGT